MDDIVKLINDLVEAAKEWGADEVDEDANHHSSWYSQSPRTKVDKIIESIVRELEGIDEGIDEIDDALRERDAELRLIISNAMIATLIPNNADSQFLKDSIKDLNDLMGEG